MNERGSRRRRRRRRRRRYSRRCKKGPRVGEMKEENEREKSPLRMWPAERQMIDSNREIRLIKGAVLKIDRNRDLSLLNHVEQTIHDREELSCLHSEARKDTQRQTMGIRKSRSSDDHSKRQRTTRQTLFSFLSFLLLPLIPTQQQQHQPVSRRVSKHLIDDDLLGSHLVTGGKSRRARSASWRISCGKERDFRRSADRTVESNIPNPRRGSRERAMTSMSQLFNSLEEKKGEDTRVSSRLVVGSMNDLFAVSKHVDNLGRKARC